MMQKISNVELRRNIQKSIGDYLRIYSKRELDFGDAPDDFDTSTNRLFNSLHKHGEFIWEQGESDQIGRQHGRVVSVHTDSDQQYPYLRLAWYKQGKLHGRELQFDGYDGTYSILNNRNGKKHGNRLYMQVNG